LYFQRVGVAVSPTIQLILTSSLSVELNGVKPSRINQVFKVLNTCYQKKRLSLAIASQGSIRKDAVKPGGTEKKKAFFSPIILRRILLAAVYSES
jgi:hypothetical protein